jgi:hypothetical protein
VRGILDAVSQLHNTLETPLRIFRILTDHLRIGKGALLLPEPESGELAPWSMRGLDRTTEHRLRIPADELTEGVLDSETAVTVLRNGGKRPLEPYLSQREYDAFNTLALVPFRSDGRLLGLLLVAESPYLEESTDVLDVAFSAVSRLVSAILVDNRETRLQAAGRQTVLEESELQAVAGELQEPEQGRVAIVSFPIDELVRRVGGDSPEVDLFRIRQDLLRVIGIMTAEVATIGTGPSGQIILLFGDDALVDPQLVLHQAGAKLTELFDELDPPLDLEAEIRRVDPGRERVEEVLAELL